MHHNRDSDFKLFILAIVMAILLWLYSNGHINIDYIPNHKYIIDWENIIRWI